MSSFHFYSDESKSQGDAIPISIKCMNSKENQFVETFSEPCEVLTPDLNLDSPIQDREDIQNSQSQLFTSPNSVQVMSASTQNQRRSRLTTTNIQTDHNRDKSRGHSAFRSRRSKSRGPSKSPLRRGRKNTSNNRGSFSQ